jgi:thymidylate synthase (FAD)
MSRINVLDHGFVELLDVMGDDREPARAARVSYSDGIERTTAQDMKLTRYLLDHGHMSPFEMVEVKFRIKAPIFVARQLVRHRTANWNEFSMRYADPGRISETEDIEFYTPDAFAAQGVDNKQSSGGSLSDYAGLNLRLRYVQQVATSIGAYEALVAQGVSREQARLVLPVSVYTEWVWKNDLRNTWGLLEQRDHADAQAETRQYAQAMATLLRARLPLLMEIWRAQRGL